MSALATLQINLAPSDYRHAKILLPHQLRTWRSQVAEILITIDLHRSAGRFSTQWNDGLENIFQLARSIDGARVLEVDYGSNTQARVSAEYFGGSKIPAKDFRGGPFYSYFYGLAMASHPYVLHTDSDMFFGGGSNTWLAEAMDLMIKNHEILFTAPLPGPPTTTGELLSLPALREADTPHAFRINTMSTRLFLIDRRRFAEKIRTLKTRRPSVRSTIKAIVEGNPAQDLPEHLFTAAMHQHGLVRYDFLGAAPGMWSLHPPYRCADFYEHLGELVARIEHGNVPDVQRGDHDMNSSMVDWTEAINALQQNRWWKRLFSRLRMRFIGTTP